MTLDDVMVNSTDFNSYFIKNKKSVRNSFLSACNIIPSCKSAWDSCVVVPNYMSITKKSARHLLRCFLDSKEFMRIPNINDFYIFGCEIPYTSDFTIKFINIKTGDYCNFLFSESYTEFKVYPSCKEFIESL